MAFEDDAHRPELYWAFGIYLGLLLLVALWARVTNARQVEASEGHASEMSQHFLAGKSTHTGLLALTTFSTIFSGYTVVGVPQEAATSGFYSVRWIGGIMAVAISMLVLTPRLRACAEFRGYTSPADFVADRFRSEVLRLYIVLSLYMANMMYIVVQFTSIDDVVHTVTNGRISGRTAAIFLGAVILLFEFLGGLKSVMLTDAIQSVLMLFCFVVVPIVLTHDYGGFVGTLRTRDCPQHADVCGLDAKPTLFYYPKMRQATAFASFVAAFASYGVLPQMIHRMYTAQQASSLKVVLIALPFTAGITMLPSIFLGIMRATSFPAEEGTAFGVMTGVLYDRGGFRRALGTILMCSGVAAIMSTADSALISMSQLLAEDIFKKRIAPDASNHTALMASKLCSLVTVVIAVLWSRDDDFDLGYLTILFLGFQVGAFPIYLFGLNPQLVQWLTGGEYKSPSSRSLILGALSGTCIFVVVTVRARANEEVEVWLQPAVWGFFMNCAMIFFVEIFAPPEWLDDFKRSYDLPPREAATFQFARGSRGRVGLTDKLLKRVCGNIAGDPCVGAKNLALLLLSFALIIVPAPWWEASGKQSRDEHSGGWPDWAIVYVSCCCLSGAILVVLAWQWTPNATPLHWTPSSLSLSRKDFEKTLSVAIIQNEDDDSSHKEEKEKLVKIQTP